MHEMKAAKKHIGRRGTGKEFSDSLSEQFRAPAKCANMIIITQSSIPGGPTQCKMTSRALLCRRLPCPIEHTYPLRLGTGFAAERFLPQCPPSPRSSSACRCPMTQQMAYVRFVLSHRGGINIRTAHLGSRGRGYLRPVRDDPRLHGPSPGPHGARNGYNACSNSPDTSIAHISGTKSALVRTSAWY
ncbi:hypothetical protein BDZ97DRAFT_2061782 [Flammula alnicola]|nr:hypothetical protein BDZ97DRAFT_2061782 [Flammula alnicola]